MTRLPKPAAGLLAAAFLLSLSIASCKGKKDEKKTETPTTVQPTDTNMAPKDTNMMKKDTADKLGDKPTAPGD